MSDCGSAPPQTCSTVECWQLRCDVGVLERGASVILTVRSRLWAETFIEVRTLYRTHQSALSSPVKSARAGNSDQELNTDRMRKTNIKCSYTALCWAGHQTTTTDVCPNYILHAKFIQYILHHILIFIVYFSSCNTRDRFLLYQLIIQHVH